MKETGSATDFELLSTKVKISAVESQKVDLLAMQRSLVAILNALPGQPAEEPVIPDTSLEILKMIVPDDSLLS